MCNTSEVQKHIELFHQTLEELNPETNEEKRNQDVTKYFVTWFRDHVQNNVEENSPFRTLSIDSSAKIKRYKGYYVNGYYFDIRQGYGNNSTYNSEVCVKRSCYDDDDQVDYHGVIEEIWELLYKLMYDKVILFKHFWFDTNKCMIVHSKRNGSNQTKKKSFSR